MQANNREIAHSYVKWIVYNAKEGNRSLYGFPFSGHVTDLQKHRLNTCLDFPFSCPEKLRHLKYEKRRGGMDSRHIQHGGLDYCDAVCYHQYTGDPVGYPGDVVTRGFQTATGRTVEQFGGTPKPVWMTEGSAVVKIIGSGFYNHMLPYQSSENIYTRQIVSASDDRTLGDNIKSRRKHKWHQM